MKRLFTFSILIFATAIMLSLQSCTSVKTLKGESESDSTAVQVNTYDSTGWKMYEKLLQQYREMVREYKPGRDTVIYVDGEPKFITVPPQLIRETIRESAQQKTTEQETSKVNRTDSLLVELLKQEKTSDKDKTSFPIWGWLAIGFLGLILIVMVGALFYLIYITKKSRVT